MRVQVHIDSATTGQLRDLLEALAQIGKSESATVGLNGPECWSATTPFLSPSEHAQVVSGLVHYRGRKLRELVTELEAK